LVQGVTEVLVYAKDRKGLFASLAAAIAASGADIADARVHTTKDGAAFDVFSIQNINGKPFGFEDDDALGALLGRMRRAALDDHPAPALRPPARRSAAFCIEPWVRIDNTITRHASVIEASGRDRPGLLAELAAVVAKAEASIVSAHIEAHGERVADVFYVQGAEGGQIRETGQIETLRDALEDVLRRGEPEAPADPARAPLAVARASTAR
jgi:[protein-PII] uridylyltransferase